MGLSSGTGPILVLDNFDSFTYNLVHQVEKLTVDPVIVIRNNEEIPDLSVFSGVILSPGPGLPEEAGILMEVVDKCVKSGIKTLGVCLGHQAINNYFGGKLRNMGTVHHGFALPVNVVSGDLLFEGINPSFQAGRYHSWMADPDFFPSSLTLTSVGPDKEIMSFRHKTLPVFGVQFHPESILTEFGDILINNWLSYNGTENS